MGPGLAFSEPRNERGMMNTLFLLFLAGICIVLFLAAARYIERANIFFPMREMNRYPDMAGLPYEEVYLDTADGRKLYGWFIPNEKADHTVLFLHGNAGNISHRLEKISLLYKMGLNVFLFDYRGYGRSEGTPSEAGLKLDARAAYDHLTCIWRVPADRIILYGESIGGAIAADLAVNRKVKALITEGAFTSIGDMAGIFYTFLPRFIISTKFDTLSKIRKITCPKLLIQSVDDEIVFFDMGKQLFDAAAGPKEFLKIRGGHNTAFLDSKEEFTRGIVAFLADLRGGRWAAVNTEERDRDGISG